MLPSYTLDPLGNENAMKTQAARVVKLVTAPQRRLAEQTTLFQQLMDDMPPEAWPKSLRMMVDNHLARMRLDQQDENPALWGAGGYTMLSTKGLLLIDDAILDEAKKKRGAGRSPAMVGTIRRVWTVALAHMDWNTGMVVLRRDELAEVAGTAVQNVSAAMRVLEGFGAIRRELTKVEGMKGPGVVTYFVNPHLAWKGSLKARAEAMQDTPAGPLLRLMEGGKADAPKDAGR